MWLLRPVSAARARAARRRVHRAARSSSLARCGRVEIISRRARSVAARRDGIRVQDAARDGVADEAREGIGAAAFDFGERRGPAVRGRVKRGGRSSKMLRPGVARGAYANASAVTGTTRPRRCTVATSR